VPPDLSIVAAALRKSLSTPSGKAYGVVDAAQCLDLAFEAKIRFGKEIRSLFLPEVQTQLWNVAPYLVPIDVESAYLDSWARQWGNNAGILLLSNANEDALYEHLRKLFVVEDEEKQEYYFRFYDPRVLRTFLPTCSALQLEDLFGSIDEIVLEGTGGAAVVHLRRDDQVLAAQETVLEAGFGLQQ
jgi:uncharacterized protein DUF4123